VLLDLMMPKLSGENVLRFIRSHPKLAKVPVVILTNAFMSEQARIVTALGVDRAIVKTECTPEKMLEIVGPILGATPRRAAAPPAVVARPPAKDSNPSREDFLNSAARQVIDLRHRCQEFKTDPESAPRSGVLAELYRQTHHLAGSAGLAGFHDLALLGGALEALLFELVEKPQFVNSSTARTVIAAMEYLPLLVEDARTGRHAETPMGGVLLVDDDPLANPLTEAALKRARLNVRTVEDPLAALDLLARTHFDLFLLDIEMPHLNGYDLCRKIRCLPGYEKTPVIYITAHGDFESRAKSILAGGNDLIAKPILPIELAVKAVTHLMRSRLAARAPESV
jgi:CheY-like chemotaxis protein